MPAAVTIAAKDLRLRLRDRSAIVIGFVAPLAISAIISFALGGVTNFSTHFGVVDEDHGQLSQAFLSVLRSPDLAKVVKVRSYPSETSVRSAVDKGKSITAAFVIPPGFSSAAVSATPLSISVLTNLDDVFAGNLAQSLAEGFSAQVNADRLSVSAALAAGVPPARLAALVDLASHLQLPERVVTKPSGSHELKPVSYYAPSMTIFFLFFAVGFGSRSWFSELRLGTLDRLNAAPVHRASVLAGKTLSIFVFGVAIMDVMATTTSALFGARWGPSLLVAAISFLMVLAVVALTAFVITVARTERQAEALSSIVVFLLALLGGNFFVISQVSPALRKLALLTPNGWALRALVDLSTGAGKAGSALTPLAAMLAFTVVVGGIALARARTLWS